ncbi:5185_t:CDS:2 [Acaulospora colombiana]|uniref:5185_t:CDS:1 n=1 Tax=Acaulospora colombiana TaxID=27376 RepID=A0ACA9M2B6_9GLOM|nr:5185_t:CDS:2 [Acaulospora colombiana]
MADFAAATPPLAYFAEKYWSRRTPLIVCLLVLIGAQIMFMEAPYYWLMCLARVLQGIRYVSAIYSVIEYPPTSLFSSAAVWVVAFAMLCDTVAENRLGRQLGIVLTALTIGFLIGAPLGGVLNDKLGYRAPFIVGIITCCLDMVGRLLFIEKHEASRWIPSGPVSEQPSESENTDSTLSAIMLEELHKLTFQDFFFSACVTPFTADLAAAARELDGIGYAHVFGAFNFAYACATAGQIYGHVKHGWTIIMCLAAGLILFGALAAAWGSGERPLLTRLVRLVNRWTSSTPKTSAITSGTLEKGLKGDALSPRKSNQQPTSSNASKTSLSESGSDITEKVISSKHVSLSETSFNKMSSRPPSTVGVAEGVTPSRSESISEVTMNGSKPPSVLPSSSQLTLEDNLSELGTSKEVNDELSLTESQSVSDLTIHEDPSKEMSNPESLDPSLPSPTVEEGTVEPVVTSGVETGQESAARDPSPNSESSTKEIPKEDEDTKRT